MKSSKEKKENNFYLLLALYIAISMLINLILEKVIQSDHLLIKELRTKFLDHQIEDILKFKRKWEWIYSVLLYIVFYIKIAFISTILYTVLFFKNKKIKYNEILEIVLVAEFIFLFVPIIKMTWFYFFMNNYTLKNFQQFFPLSLANFFNINQLPLWLLYPMQTINLFEIVYIYLLSYLISKKINFSFFKTSIIILTAYLPTIFLWIMLIIFLILNYT